MLKITAKCFKSHDYVKIASYKYGYSVQAVKGQGYSFGGYRGDERFFIFHVSSRVSYLLLTINVLQRQSASVSNLKVVLNVNVVSKYAIA